MRAAVLAVVLILTACGSASAPQARASIQAGATPTGVGVASPTSAPTPISVTPAAPTTPPSAIAIPSPSAAPVSAWMVTHVRGSDCGAAVSGWSPCFSSVSCPTNGFCVAVGAAGSVTASSNPTAWTPAWAVTHVDGSNIMTGISCPISGLCVAVDQVGNVITSSNPTGGASAWTAVHVVASFLTGVSCPTVDLCVAVDESGNVVTSTKPGGGAAAWKVTNLNGGVMYGPHSMHSSVSCPTGRFCVGLGNDDEARGFEISSTDPTGGPTAWTRSIHIGGSILNSVSCPSSNLCVAVSSWGDVVTSTTPGVPPAA